MFEELDKLILKDFDVFKDSYKKLQLEDGERRVVSILFADIKGFTAISEKLDVEQVKVILDKLLQVFTICIKSHGGYVDKYEGDLVMALFGAKKATENDIEKSVYAAFEMLKKLSQFNQVLASNKKLKGINLGVRIGINSGLVATGKVGERREGDFTVYGDAVNLASRMEQNAPINSILIPKETKDLIEKKFVFEDKGNISVKGKQKPIHVFTVKRPNEIAVKRWQDRKSIFIGRLKEFEELKSKFKKLNSINDSNIKILGVRGFAGIGKSRLIYEFIENLPADRNFKEKILYGECSNISESAFSLFVNLVKYIFKISATDTNEQVEKKFTLGIDELLENEKSSERLIEVVPFLKFLLGLKTKDIRLSSEGEAFRDQIRVALKVLLSQVALKVNSQGMPLIVVLESLNSIDSLSLDTLEFILQSDSFQESNDFNSQKIIFILEYRPFEEFEKIFLGNKNFEEINVSPLTDEESLSLMNSMLGELTISKKIRDMFLKRASGNPFYIEEWSDYIAQESLFEKKENEIYLKEKEISIPSGINSLILSRIDKLPLNQKILLQEAAVIGRQFHLNVLLEVENRFKRKTDLDNLISDLEVNNFINQKFNFERDYFSVYEFKNINTQEVAYNNLLISNRKLLHNIIGEIIELEFEDSLYEYFYELANHFEKGENWLKAIEYLEKAGLKAKKIFDNHKSIEFFDRFIRIFEEANFIEIEKLINVLINKGNVLELIGNWTEAEKCYQKAYDLSENSQMKTFLASSLHELGRIFTFRGDFDKALNFQNKAFNIFQSENDLFGMSKVLGNIGVVYKNKGDLDLAIDCFQNVIDLSKKFDNKLIQAKAFGNLAMILKIKGKLNESMDYFGKALEIFDILGEKRNYSNALMNLGIIYEQIGNYEKAMDYCEEALKLNEFLGDKRRVSMCIVNIGNIYQHLGNYEKAMDYYKIQLEISKKIGDPRITAATLSSMGNILREEGKFEKSLKYFKKSLEIKSKLSNPRGVALGIGNIGKVHFFMGNYKEAISEFDKVLLSEEKLGNEEFINQLYILKTHSLIRMKRISEAQETLENIQIKEKITANTKFHFMLFGFIFNHFQENRKKISSEFESFLKELKDDKNKAIVLFEICLLVKESNEFDKWKKLALSKLTELYSLHPHYEIKQKIDFLN